MVASNDLVDFEVPGNANGSAVCPFWRLQSLCRLGQVGSASRDGQSCTKAPVKWTRHMELNPLSAESPGHSRSVDLSGSIDGER